MENYETDITFNLSLWKGTCKGITWEKGSLICEPLKIARISHFAGNIILRVSVGSHSILMWFSIQSHQTLCIPNIFSHYFCSTCLRKYYCSCSIIILILLSMSRQWFVWVLFIVFYPRNEYCLQMIARVKLNFAFIVGLSVFWLVHVYNFHASYFISVYVD